MKKRALILLLACVLSTCGQKPASSKATTQVTIIDRQETKTETEVEPPKASEPPNESSHDMREDNLAEDWPDWFVAPTGVPEDEEVKQAIQGAEFDALPKWMQVVAVRPRSVVAWLEMTRLVTPPINPELFTGFLKENPEYIMPIMSRLKIIFEKAEAGEQSNNVGSLPQEFIEIQDIVNEIARQLE